MSVGSSSNTGTPEDDVNVDVMYARLVFGVEAVFNIRQRKCLPRQL